MYTGNMERLERSMKVNKRAKFLWEQAGKPAGRSHYFYLIARQELDPFLPEDKYTEENIHPKLSNA